MAGNTGSSFVLYPASCEAGGSHIRVSGALEGNTIQALRAVVAEALEISPFLTLDLRHCDYCEEEGVGIIATTLRHCRQAEGMLTLLVTPDSHVARRIRQAGLDRLAHVEEVADA